jgi:Fe-coproporphyrin III synthase
VGLSKVRFGQPHTFYQKGVTKTAFLDRFIAWEFCLSMGRIQANQNNIALPRDFLRRRQMPENGNYWLSERDGDLILHPRRPDAQKLYIEATTVCNLECTTCIRNVWSDPRERMTMDTFEQIVASIPRFPNLDRVVFTSFGEPLTHPNLFDMIAAVRRLDIPVTVGTNGLLLTAAHARELVRLGVDRVMVSIDGARPETFAGVRGANLDRVIQNIQGLNAVRHEMGAAFPSVGIEFVMMKSNYTELPEVSSLAARLNASKVLVSNVLAYTENMLAEMMYGYEPVEPDRFNAWAVRADAWVMWATTEMPRMHWGAERRCRFVKDKSIVVGWDGGVSPCYALSHNYSYFAIDAKQKQVCRYLLGNVNQQTLDEIWMSEDFVRFRSEVSGFHFPSCPDCDLRATCDLRERNEGCWGWNPSCADCLWAQDIVRCP